MRPNPVILPGTEEGLRGREEQKETEGTVPSTGKRVEAPKAALEVGWKLDLGREEPHWGLFQ